MQDSLESNRQKPMSIRQKHVTMHIVVPLILMSLIPVVVFNPAIETRKPILVIRVDDIQDFAFREAQLFLINESIVNEVPLSLAIIAGMFGEDREIVQAVKLAVNSGSEVSVHGWNHEDLAKLSLKEQAALLSQSRNRLKETLDYNVRILTPPMFSFDEDTIVAMHDEGYNVISTSIDRPEPSSILKMISLPATVELSHFSNGTWTMKHSDSVKIEISESIQRYGFAIIVTHPQEFIKDGELDQFNMELYRTLLRTLKKDCSFETIGGLAETSYADNNEVLNCILGSG